MADTALAAIGLKQEIALRVIDGGSATSAAGAAVSDPILAGGDHDREILPLVATELPGDFPARLPLAAGQTARAASAIAAMASGRLDREGVDVERNGETCKSRES